MGSKMRIAASIQRIGFSSGSFIRPTEDLLRWNEGLFAAKLLTPASLRKMTAPFKGDYACGLYVKRVNGHLMTSMMGTTLGFKLRYGLTTPDDRIAVNRLGNLNAPYQ